MSFDADDKLVVDGLLRLGEIALEAHAQKKRAAMNRDEVLREIAAATAKFSTKSRSEIEAEVLAKHERTVVVETNGDPGDENDADA